MNCRIVSIKTEQKIILRVQNACFILRMSYHNPMYKSMHDLSWRAAAQFYLSDVCDNLIYKCWITFALNLSLPRIPFNLPFWNTKLYDIDNANSDSFTKHFLLSLCRGLHNTKTVEQSKSRSSYNWMYRSPNEKSRIWIHLCSWRGVPRLFFFFFCLRGPKRNNGWPKPNSHRDGTNEKGY